MNVLYLDASRDRLSIGLESHTQWLTREQLSGRHDAVLLDAMIDLCSEASVRLQDLERCVIVNGPGSFTGLRIAVSAVHALDAVGPLKALPIDQLSLLGAAAESEAEAVIDARMQDVYRGCNRDGFGIYQQVDVVPLDALSEDVRRICHCDEQALFPNATGVLPDLSILRALAARQPQSAWINASQLTPRYVRNTVSWKPLSEQPSKLYDR